MKHIIPLWIIAAAAPAAAGHLALDNRADDATCIDAARFADEVAAKVGFVPWDASAATSVHVRVARDGDAFTGTFSNVDGNTKQVAGATCLEVRSSLVITVAAAVDTEVAAPRGKVTAPVAADDSKVEVTFASNIGRMIDVSRRSGNARNSRERDIVATYYDDVCTTPCSARMPRGRQYLSFRDPDTGASATLQVSLDRPVAVTVDRKSHRWKRIIGYSVGGTLTGLGVAGFATESHELLSGIGIGVGVIWIIGALVEHDGISATSAPR